MARELLPESRKSAPLRSPIVATAAIRRRIAQMMAAAAMVAACAAGCGQSPEVLTDEAFRTIIPDNAELVDEVVDDGSSLTVDGERTVLRTFAPTPPAAASDVLAVLVAEGEDDGWLFTEPSTTLAVGTKEIDGRQWMVSVAVSDDTVQQLFAGR
jgi:hypothetical protein